MFNCKDCGVCTKEIHEYYMVNDDIWYKYGAGEDMLCLGCLEKRMGRELNKYDFKDVPLNWLADKFPKSKRFLDRIQKGVSYDDRDFLFKNK